MTIEKKLKNFGKKVAIGTVLFGSLTLTGCGLFGKDDNPSPPNNPPTNQAPETVIGKDFGDGLSGEVDYTVCGDDSDGIVNYLEVWTNGNYSKHINPLQTSSFCKYPDEQIDQGWNTLEAIATDDDGKDSKVETISFYSPTEAEGRAVIDQVLAGKGYVEGVDYEKGRTMYVNNIPVLVDFRLLCSNGLNTRGIIEFVSHSENLNNELYEKGILENVGNAPLYLIYLPEEEVIPRVRNHLDNVVPFNNFCQP